MARHPRVLFAGAMYHVSIQGNRDCSIYVDVDDRETHLSLIADGVCEDGWICHAYCQMTTHYHLLVQTPEPNLDRAMHRLNSAYAHEFNRRHGYSGHLFKQRYSAKLVVDDLHLLEVARYVVLNPVEARMCRHPKDWPWSSYQATVGLAKTPSFLDNDWLVRVFDEDVSKGRRRFVRFVDEGLTTGARHRGSSRGA
jgi:REP element-mobilizing transposase RayT